MIVSGRITSIKWRPEDSDLRRVGQCYRQLSLVRLRMAEIKDASAASSRFNYADNDEELGDLAKFILEIARAVDQTHVVLNNNFEDQGQRNARTLIRLLAGTAQAKQACLALQRECLPYRIGKAYHLPSFSSGA